MAVAMDLTTTVRAIASDLDIYEYRRSPTLSANGYFAVHRRSPKVNAGACELGCSGIETDPPLGTLTVWVTDAAGRFWSSASNTDASWAAWSQAIPVH